MVGNDTAVEILARSFRRLGINVDHINKEGMTALLIAAKNGFIECATILALHGRACISFRDRQNGMTAEQWARSNGCSTPEVLPFSTSAALWQYKMARYGHILSDSYEENEFDDATTDTDAGATSGSVAAGGGCDRDMSADLSLDEKIAELRLCRDRDRPRSAESRSSLGKRSSLPSIKLSSPHVSRESLPNKTPAGKVTLPAIERAGGKLGDVCAQQEEVEEEEEEEQEDEDEETTSPTAAVNKEGGLKPAVHGHHVGLSQQAGCRAPDSDDSDSSLSTARTSLDSETQHTGGLSPSHG